MPETFFQTKSTIEKTNLIFQHCKKEHPLTCYQMRRGAIKKSDFLQSGISTLHDINKTDNFLQVSNESYVIHTHSNLDLISNEKVFLNNQHSTKELMILGSCLRRTSQINNVQHFKKSHSP